MSGIRQGVKLIASIIVNIVAFNGLLSFINSVLLWIGQRVGVANLTFEVSTKKTANALTAVHLQYHRPLSRRLDRCDRVIHNESGDPNGGNMCSFSGATCTSRDVTMQTTFLTRKSALIYRRDVRQRVASLTLNCNGVLAIRAYTNLFSQVKVSRIYMQPCVISGCET